MATVNTANILVGAPDQLTTGAIMDAPIGSTLPTTANATIDTAFTGSGYVSEDGIKLSTDYSTNDIKEWGGATVRKILESFDGTISWTELEMSYESMCHAFGAENVQKTAATSTHGEQVKVSIGAHIPPARSWVFKMKDGDARILIVVPNGQVTSVGDMDFVSTDAIKPEIELSCYDDGTGNCIYIYTDNGVKASA